MYKSAYCRAKRKKLERRIVAGESEIISSRFKMLYPRLSTRVIFMFVLAPDITDTG